jgi:hypothetical protein
VKSEVGIVKLRQVEILRRLFHAMNRLPEIFEISFGRVFLCPLDSDSFELNPQRKNSSHVGR